MLPPVTANRISGRQNRPPTQPPARARLGSSSGRPRLATHIVPPCGLSGSCVFRYSIDSVTSKVLIAMPAMPTIHIQNTAPGPPSSTAMATPAMLPRPTVADSAADSAWKCEMAPGPLPDCQRPVIRPAPWVSERYWQKPLHTVNSTPVNSSASSIGTDSITAFTPSRKRKKASIDYSGVVSDARAAGAGGRGFSAGRRTG